MIKIFVLLVLSISTTACSGLSLKTPATLDMTPPDGPPEYQQGWLDGCTSGLSTVNTNANLFFGSHEYTLDAELWKQNLYRIVWKDAYNFCTYHMFSNLLMKM
jgi:hypothetical protein